MKAGLNNIFSALMFIMMVILASASARAQKSDFWSRVQFGGAVGLSIGSGYTDVTLAPSAIYNFNEYIATGVGLQGTYVNAEDLYSSFMYGGSLILLGNPIPAIQLSAELEQLRVNNTFDLPAGGSVDDDFWNTALYLGAGYRTGNFTIGARYNVLFDKDKFVYNDALMPFVRIYF